MNKEIAVQGLMRARNELRQKNLSGLRGDLVGAISDGVSNQFAIISSNKDNNGFFLSEDVEHGQLTKLLLISTMLDMKSVIGVIMSLESELGGSYGMKKALVGQDLTGDQMDRLVSRISE